ncbi:MAG: hypothetical protein PUE18_01510 [Firmicutes bacterium]|nr:hypothetical protein [Bacillota bacterium]
MFGRKKMYKKGLADAMHAYEDFGKKQEAALEYMREEVRSGNKKLEDALTSLGDDLNGIYKHLNSQEKAALYHLSTPMDLKELDAVDKRLLLAVLYQLAEDEGEKLTDEQRTYIRSVQKYMEITNPQTFADFSDIENINSLDVQKTFLRVSLEFLYLQDGDELSDKQEKFFDYFSINKKQATVIENEVSRLFNAVGPQGVAEKYGYVPEDVTDVVNEETNANTTITCASSEISEDDADEIMKLGHKPHCIETVNYIVAPYQDGFFRIEKKNHKWVNVKEGKNQKDFPPLYFITRDRTDPRNYSYSLVTHEDYVYYYRGNASGGAIYAFDVSSLTSPERLCSAFCKDISLYDNSLFFIDDNTGLCQYDILKKKCKVLLPGVEGSWKGGAVYATHTGVYFSKNIYDSQRELHCSAVSYYDYSTKQEEVLFKTQYQAVRHIFFANEEKMCVGCEDNYNWEFSEIQYNEIKRGDWIRITKSFDVWGPKYIVSPEQSVSAYPDKLIYVAEDKTLKAFDFRKGETLQLASNVVNGKSSSPIPAPVFRMGNWLYYQEKTNSEKMTSGDVHDYVFCKVSLDAPYEIYTLQSYDFLNWVPGTHSSEYQIHTDNIEVTHLAH